MTWTTQPRSKVGNLSAITCGHGPHILLIHGVGLRAEAWAEQIATLGQRYRITAVDMPGHGSSAPIAATDATTDPDLGDFVDRILPCIDEPTIVMGHSMGAMIAVELAARQPLVRGVVAMNAIYKRSDTARSAIHARVQQLRDTGRADPTPTLQRWFSDLSDPAAVACHDWLGRVDFASYLAAYQVFAHHDGPSDERLQTLTVPALFITGSREPNSTPQMSTDMAGLCPKGRAAIIDRAAHMMPMTHAQQVQPHLQDFLKDCQDEF